MKVKVLTIIAYNIDFSTLVKDGDDIPDSKCHVMEWGDHIACLVKGSNITTDRACTTFVNNLSIKNIPTSSAGLPSGSVWKNGNVLNIV